MPNITFIDGDRKIQVDAKEGLSLLEVAKEHNIDVEGACDGSMVCTTCHVIVEPEWFAKLDPAEEGEEDMLDMASGLTDTSRLGCQIIVTEEMEGLCVTLPPK